VSNRQHAGPGPASPDIPEPSLAERARTLTSIGSIGSLSTHSPKFPGFPFGSMMPFAADDLGRPVFLISSMAMHTQNLHQDERASLLITQPGVIGDPLGAARLTLIGRVKVAPAAEVRDLYLSATRTHGTGKVTPISRTTGWRWRAFTSSAASV
jgi:putative heme iron utilization protein